MEELFVTVFWDDEAKVWFVSESNIPGLATEAESESEMLEKLKVLVPELCELNRHLMDCGKWPNLPVQVKTERIETFRLAG